MALSEILWSRVVLVSAVAILGGCVAGAAVDRDAVREEARSYRSYQAPDVRVMVELSRQPLPVQPVIDVFERFPKRVQVNRGSAAQLSDCEIRFEVLPDDKGHRMQVICRSNPSVLLIDEWIPLAFYMDQLRVARIGERDDALWVFRARARATTGRYWVGIYRADGQPLFKAAIPHGQMNAVEANTDQFTMISSDGVRTVVSWR